MTRSTETARLIEEALSAVDDGRDADAVPAFEAAIAAGETSLHFELGNSLASIGRWRGAVEHLRISAEGGRGGRVVQSRSGDRGAE